MYSWVTLEHLAKWTKGTLTDPGAAKLPVRSISTDSRSLKKGEIFAAISGATFDGHAFVEQVAGQGAAAAIVERKTAAAIPQLIVKDTSRALVDIGEAIRDAFQGPVFAVTGSAGKSSTKEMIADLMGENTVRSPKSFNNLWGVPRTLFLVEDGTENLILEMGMNALGELEEICRHFKPTAGLITNIGDAHVGKVGGKEKIYQAKKEVFDYLAAHPPAQVAVNADDAAVLKACYVAFAGTQPQMLLYSAEGREAQVRVVSKQMDPFDGSLTLELDLMGVKGRVRVGLFGLHQAQNIAAACAAALLLGLTPNQILERLPHLKSTSQRGELIPLSDDRTLIDESYNSNPEALRASLESVAQLDPTRRRVFVLGEMRELEEFSQELHAKVGRALVELYKQKKFPFLLVGVGNGFLPFLTTIERELPGIPCVAVPDAAHAIERLKSLVLARDIILVKGSRGVQLEAVVQWLKA